MNVNKVVLLVLLSALVSSCAAYSKKTADSTAAKLIVCKDPRPQICTTEYNPVCARYNDGRKKTESTGCIACGNHEVTGYIMGVCKTDVTD